MREYRTLQEVSEEYFAERPEEIEGFLTVLFEEYAADKDSAALLSGLRIIARVKGISHLASEICMTRQGLQKALSTKGNPRLDNVNAIMQGLGYHLMPQKLEAMAD